MATTEITPRGWEVLQEAAVLLHGLEISTARGALLEGKYVHLIIDPRWSEESGNYWLLITCHPIDQRRVEWVGLPIIIEPIEDAGAPLFVARLNDRGQVIVHNLPAGAYRLSVSAQWYYSDKPIIESGFKTADTHEGMPEQLAAAELQEEAPWPTLPATFSSNDSRVLVTPEQVKAGEIALSFETRHDKLDGARVRFAIVQPSGKVEVTGEIRLTKIESRTLWGERWEGAVTVTSPRHMMFEVFPFSILFWMERGGLRSKTG